MRFLVEEGVNKDETDKEGRTPLMLASQNNHMAIVQFLEEYKTNKNKADMSLKYKAANTRDALRAAANKGCLEAVRFLVEEEVCQKDTDKEGMSPLLLAFQSGHLSIARYLVESMQEESDDSDNSWGSAALIYSIWKEGHVAVMEWLLEQGADVNKANDCGLTPLHRAAIFSYPDTVTCLLKWGASLTARVANHGARCLPIDFTFCEEIRQLIRDEETRRRDHGYKRAVIPNPTDAERKRARLEHGEDEDETKGQGQAIANAAAEEDDGENDDSGSEVEYY